MVNQGPNLDAGAAFESAVKSPIRTIKVAAILGPFKKGWALDGDAKDIAQFSEGRIPKPAERGLGVIGYVICEVDADQFQKAGQRLNNPDVPVEIIEQSLGRVIYAEDEKGSPYELVPTNEGLMVKRAGGIKILLSELDILADKFGYTFAPARRQPVLSKQLG